ncbi:caspase family protein [Streptomyces acidiscabies]|uniref:LigA protein n=1 Tax=Streptomyces acidiscabies TaxID=42234 RepID=A0A0L0K570_9ACTN|nr:caspase family protein [Streptomyces acidiscabies]KND32986.1 LigA protein [Streptomyces acidiscabies]
MRECRRFFIALGVERYLNLPEHEQLGSVPSDIRAVRELLDGFGYQHVLPGLGEYESADQIRQKLRHWSADIALTPDDVVVFYYAGHGLVQDRDRHYLLCWDSRDDEDAATTALATEDLVRILCRGDLSHLLLVLDTCAGGAGSADATALALQTIAYRRGGSGTAGGLWFLASARRKDLAEEGRFATALPAAVRVTTERTGQRQQFLDLTELVKAVNERFEADGTGQRAELASGLVTGLAPFLPNADYREALPPIGTDLELQRRAATLDLVDHFGPRSRGVEFESEHGLYFSGRTRVLTELTRWLSAPEGDGRGRVVTGPPGCGKSAVLGRVVALSDPGYRARFDLDALDPATVVPESCVTAAVHARHKRLDEIVERIAVHLGIDVDGTAALLQELTRRGRAGSPTVIVVDAVDEAGSDTAADAGGHGEPRRITRELLRPLSEIPGVRLLVGTRPELVGPLGATFHPIDLDRPGYRAERTDVAGYVTKMLLAEEEPQVPSPYRDRPALAREVAVAVAAKAAGVFLYARTTARTLRSDRTPVDVHRPGWADDLPSEIGEAFDDYLARFGPDEPRVRRMLLPLAFSEGTGLPRGRIWTSLATALAGRECTESDITWLLDVAGAYVAEVVDDDRRSVYRLYHKALAEHLRRAAGRTTSEVQTAVHRALVDVVPALPDGGRDWFAAPPYVRQHLATHAAAASLLSDLIADPGFLLACEPLGLLRALASVDGEAPRRIRTAYEQVAHRLTPDRPLGDRAADLQLSARRCEADELAERIDRLGVSLPWTARWAWWSASGTHRLLSGHADRVDCVAVGDLDDRPIAVTGSPDATVRVWDLTTQRQIGEPLRAGVAVGAVAIGELGDYTVALVGRVDGVIQVWDLSTGQPYGDALTGHTNSVQAISIGLLDGLPVALSAGNDGTARVWDLVERRQLGESLLGHRRTVRGVALADVEGTSVAVTGGDDRAIRVWDLSGLRAGESARVLGGPLIGPVESVTALCVGEVDGRTALLVGDRSGLLSLWDLAEQRQIGQPVAAHRYFDRSGVQSAVFGSFDGRPVALTCGRQETRLWELPGLRQVGPPLRGHVDHIQAAALASRGDTSLAVTVGRDRTARIWDLSADQPEVGYSGQVHSVALYQTSDMPVVITGGGDGTARLWDLRGHVPVGAPMAGHFGRVRAVALGTIEGRLIALTGGEDTEVRIWDALTGAPVGEPLTGHTNSVRCVALGVLRDTPVVVSSSGDGTVRVWDYRTGCLRTPPLAGHIGGVQYMAVREVGQGMEIAVVTALGHAYLWRVTEPQVGSPEAHFDLKKLSLNANAIGVAFLDGRPVVLSTYEGNGVHVHDIVTREPAGPPLLGHTDWALCATLAKVQHRTLVASIGSDGSMRVWDLATGKPLGPPFEISTIVLGASKCPAPALGTANGTPVAVSADNREVRVWNLATMLPSSEPLSGADRGLASADIIQLPGGRSALVTGSYFSGVRLHDLEDGRQIAPQITFASYGLYGAASVSAGGRPVVVISGWSGADVWSLEPRERLSRRFGITWRALPHTFDGLTLVVSVAGDFTLHAWELDTQVPYGPPMTGHTARVTALRGGPPGAEHLLASASLDGTVRLWDLRTGGPAAAPMADHALGARNVDFLRLDTTDLLVSGAGDGTLRFWHPLTGEPAGHHLSPFPSPVQALVCAEVHGTPLLVAGDGFGLLRIWNTRDSGWTTELDVGSGINDIAVAETGYVCLATEMGAVALGLASADPGETP